MEVDQIGVHRTHCCILHGCKYGDELCPVETGVVTQDFVCEDCESEGIETVEFVHDVISGFIDRCPHCGHVL